MNVTEEYLKKRLDEKNFDLVMALKRLQEEYKYDENWRVLIKRCLARIYHHDLRFGDMFYSNPRRAVEMIINEFQELFPGQHLERYRMKRASLNEPFKKGNVRWIKK